MCSPNERWHDSWPIRFLDDLRRSDNMFISLFWQWQRNVVHAYHNIRRIVEWLPILWHDRDWDYAHILTILSYKLRRMRSYMTDDKKVCRQIAYAELLIERILADDYCSEELEQHKLKWGTYCRRKKWTNGQSIGNAYHIRQNATTLQKWQQQILEERAIHQKQAECKQKDWQRLFRHLHTYLQKWWD